MGLGYDIAIVGATGVVGEAFLELLHLRQFPLGKVYAVASENSLGRDVAFGAKKIPIDLLKDFDFSKAQIAFFSAGADVSKKYAPKAAEAGCIVIDNSSAFRTEPDIPLIVPEVNPDSLRDFRNRNIVANPNCSTIQLVVALKPIYDAVGIDRIDVSTYQSVSGAGRAAIEELARQTANLLSSQEIKAEVFPHQIAFNVIPHIDEFQDNGFTKEEMKMVLETQKIFGDGQLAVNATAVRVPVFFGHSEAVHIQTRDRIDATQAKDILRGAKGIVLFDNDQAYPTATTHAANQDAVFVGRVRNDLFSGHGLNLWVVADNVKKGAALNAIEIAELLIKENFYLD